MDFILEKDFVIPKGTIFKEKVCNTEYYEGNYEAIISTSKDSCANFIIDNDVIADNKDIFRGI